MLTPAFLDGTMCVMFLATMVCVVIGSQRMNEGHITFGFIAIPLGYLAVIYAMRYFNTFDFNGSNQQMRAFLSYIGVVGTLTHISVYALNGRITNFIEKIIFKGR